MQQKRMRPTDGLQQYIHNEAIYTWRSTSIVDLREKEKLSFLEIYVILFIAGLFK